MLEALPSMKLKDDFEAVSQEIYQE